MNEEGSLTRRELGSVASLLPLLLGLIGTPTPVQAQNDPLRGVDGYVNEAIAEWGVPGLGLAVVKGGAVVHMAGYGVKNLMRSDPVDSNTLFAIGSASKAFTAMLMAMLVQENKVEWDDPVIKHLPSFQTFDPYVTRELTLRDLLTHRSGLSRGDHLWYASDFDREEIVRRIRLLEPTWSLRSHYGYQNIMFLVAGEVEEELTGRSWDRLVQERIFDPLGMERSTTSTLPLAQLSNVATPHEEIEGRIEPIQWRNIDNIAPAGSINSSAADMAQWIQLQLGNGTYRGRQLVKPAMMREMHQSQMVVSIDTAMERMIPSVHFHTYGLGWHLQDYRGRKLVSHNGNIDGMSALVALIPEEDVGLVILTNLNLSRLPNALMYYIFDRYLDAPTRDWSADMLAFFTERREKDKRRRRQLLDTRATGTEPSLPLDRYSGEYEHPMYGRMRVHREGDKLMVESSPAFVGDLEHWHYDTFRARWHDRSLGTTFLTFTLDARGEIEEVMVEGLGEFRRRPAPAMHGDERDAPYAWTPSSTETRPHTVLSGGSSSQAPSTSIQYAEGSMSDRRDINFDWRQYDRHPLQWYFLREGGAGADDRRSRVE